MGLNLCYGLNPLKIQRLILCPGCRTGSGKFRIRLAFDFSQSDLNRTGFVKDFFIPMYMGMKDRIKIIFFAGTFTSAIKYKGFTMLFFEKENSTAAGNNTPSYLCPERETMVLSHFQTIFQKYFCAKPFVCPILLPKASKNQKHK